MLIARSKDMRKDELGVFVRTRREELGISQAELGKRCGLSQAYIGQLEVGANPKTGAPISPTSKAMEKLQKGLQVPYSTIERLARGLPVEIDPSERLSQAIQQQLKKIRKSISMVSFESKIPEGIIQRLADGSQKGRTNGNLLVSLEAALGMQTGSLVSIIWGEQDEEQLDWLVKMTNRFLGSRAVNDPEIGEIAALLRRLPAETRDSYLEMARTQLQMLLKASGIGESKDP